MYEFNSSDLLRMLQWLLVSRPLWHSEILWDVGAPALTHWANMWRTSGALEW